MLNTWLSVYVVVSLTGGNFQTATWINDNPLGGTFNTYSYTGWSLDSTIKIYACTGPTGVAAECDMQNLKLLYGLVPDLTLASYLDKSKCT